MKNIITILGNKNITNFIKYKYPPFPITVSTIILKSSKEKKNPKSPITNIIKI